MEQFLYFTNHLLIIFFVPKKRRRSRCPCVFFIYSSQFSSVHPSGEQKCGERWKTLGWFGGSYHGLSNSSIISGSARLTLTIYRIHRFSLISFVEILFLYLVLESPIIRQSVIILYECFLLLSSYQSAILLDSRATCKRFNPLSFASSCLFPPLSRFGHVSFTSFKLFPQVSSLFYSLPPWNPLATRHCGHNCQLDNSSSVNMRQPRITIIFRATLSKQNMVLVPFSFFSSSTRSEPGRYQFIIASSMGWVKGRMYVSI